MPVPADTFIDGRSSPLSAIWAADVDEFTLLDFPADMVAFHAPRPGTRPPVGLLPAREELVACRLDADP